MTLTQILQKIKSAFYTKKEIDAMGGGSSLSDAISQKANDSDVVHKSGNETVYGVKDFGNQISTHRLGGLSNSLELYGGNDYNDGIWFQLSGYRTSNNGNTGLRIRQTLNKETDEYYEIFYDNGSLYPGASDSQTLGLSDHKWKDVNTTLLNGKTPDLIEEQGDGYIRYSSGLQMCWGVVNAEFFEPYNGHYGKTVSFPKNFLTNIVPVINISQWRFAGNLTQNVNIIDPTNSRFGIETDVQAGVFYTAIGKWK